MIASFRSLCLVGSLAMLAACGSQDDADNLAALDAKLTNGMDNEADVLAALGGHIEKAPAAIETKTVAPEGRTLGGLARQQASRDGVASPPAGAGGDCAKSVKYGADWAERMPAPFRLYPHGKLIEAAGTDEARCMLRILSFSTQASIDQVMDYYYTQAKRAGYDAEHLLSQGEHQLGGTRGASDAAYVVFARRGEGDLTDVDVVANAK